MTTSLTPTELHRILVQAAGLPESIDENRVMNSSFEDLDVDSIARIAVITSIENEKGVRLDDTPAESVPRPAQLLAIVNDGATAE